MKEVPPTKMSLENTRLVKADSRAAAYELEQEQPPILSRTARIATTFGVNLCESPVSDGQWVGLLGPKTIVSLLQHCKQGDGTFWFYVKAGTQRGWVPSAYLIGIE